MNTEFRRSFDKAQDFLPINGTDYVELYVGNAKTGPIFINSLWFPITYRQDWKQATGDFVLTSWFRIRFCLVLTTPYKADSEIAEHIKKHGDGVKVIALWVDDASVAYEEIYQQGRHEWMAPQTMSDKWGKERPAIKLMAIPSTCSERKDYNGRILTRFWKMGFWVQPRIHRTPIHRSHGWKCWIGHHEWMGEILCHDHGICKPHYLWWQRHLNSIYSVDE